MGVVGYIPLLWVTQVVSQESKDAPARNLAVWVPISYSFQTLNDPPQTLNPISPTRSRRVLESRVEGLSFRAP